MRHIYTLPDTPLDTNLCGLILLLCLAAWGNATHGAWSMMENLSTIRIYPLFQKEKL